MNEFKWDTSNDIKCAVCGNTNLASYMGNGKQTLCFECIVEACKWALEKKKLEDKINE